MGHDENYDRTLWQSARSRSGKIAEPPAPYHVAWELAHQHEMLRNLAIQIRSTYPKESVQ